jgi:hypothetical protein
LNRSYREVLFKDRNLLIDYLHVPVKQRNKFLSYSRVELEQKLLSFVNERNENVYETQYLPHMERMLRVEPTMGGMYEMRRNMKNDYVKRFGKECNTNMYGTEKEFNEFVEDYKQEFKKSLYLSVDYVPKKYQCEVKVKVDKPKEKFIQVDKDREALRQRQEKQHEEYLEKQKQLKIQKMREEREKEKQKQKINKMLNDKKGKKR